MKKISSLFLCVVIVLSCFSYAFANNVTIDALESDSIVTYYDEAEDCIVKEFEIPLELDVLPDADSIARPSGAPVIVVETRAFSDGTLEVRLSSTYFDLIIEMVGIIEINGTSSYYAYRPFRISTWVPGPHIAGSEYFDNAIPPIMGPHVFNIHLTGRLEGVYIGAGFDRLVTVVY